MLSCLFADDENRKEYAGAEPGTAAGEVAVIMSTAVAPGHGGPK